MRTDLQNTKLQAQGASNEAQASDNSQELQQQIKEYLSTFDAQEIDKNMFMIYLAAESSNHWEEMAVGTRDDLFLWFNRTMSILQLLVGHELQDKHKPIFSTDTELAG